jgi:hypothetical protein
VAAGENGSRTSYNPSTQEHETGELQVLGQPGLHSETLSQNKKSRVLLAHTCNPSYSGGRDQEAHGSLLAQANSSQDPILKKLITKKGWWSGSRCRP